MDNAQERLRVLIVEDNEDDAVLIQREIKRGGFQIDVRRVYTASAMREALQEETWDVVISDHAMPNFSAPEALALLWESGCDLPFIVVSGSIGEEFAVSLMKQGADDYLLKDRMSRLPEAIRHAVNERRLLREAREAQKQLARSEARFRSIFSEALDVILIIDSYTGTIIDVNRMIEHYLGYPPQAVIGQHFSTLFPTQNDEGFLNDVRAADSVFAFQRFRHAAGGTLPMDITATMIPWEEGPVILLTLRDATERLQAEEARLMAERLRNDLEKEKELHELKNRFISMASHEFRTPLTTIQLSANMLNSYIDRMDAERRQKHFDKITESIAHTTALLDDVLFIGRAEAGAEEFIPVTIDLLSFCREIIEVFQAANPTHTLIFEDQGACRHIQGDLRLMRHILTNLISNAIKYSPEDSRVWLRLRCEDTGTTIIVQDEGIGIPEKDQSRLFQTFFRAANVGNVSGTGLGLAITHRAVEMHGGKISFESQVGVGTTFTVSLPVEDIHGTHTGH